MCINETLKPYCRCFETTPKEINAIKKALDYTLAILCDAEYKRLGPDTGNNRAYALITLECAGHAISLLRAAQETINTKEVV